MNNLEKINELLQDDKKLEKYINEIEKNQIQTTTNLKEKILSKVNQKKKNKNVDICKIAACLIFSLAICRVDFIKNDDLSIDRLEQPKANTQISQKLSDFCKWVTTPIEKEEKEEK